MRHNNFVGHRIFEKKKYRNQCSTKVQKKGVRVRKQKIAYPTREDAEFASEWMTKKFKQTYHPYRCQKCGFFHVGRPPLKPRMMYRFLDEMSMLEMGERVCVHLNLAQSEAYISRLCKAAERRANLLVRQR